MPLIIYTEHTYEYMCVMSFLNEHLTKVSLGDYTGGNKVVILNSDPYLRMHRPGIHHHLLFKKGKVGLGVMRFGLMVLTQRFSCLLMWGP
jgi:hypothetical protein